MASVEHWLHELRDPHSGEWTSGGGSSNPLKVESGVPGKAPSPPSFEEFVHEQPQVSKGPAAREVLGDFKDTEEKWSVQLPDGSRVYDPMRAAEQRVSVEKMLHEEIPAQNADGSPRLDAEGDPIMERSVNAPPLAKAPDGQKRALFTAGVPASGKTSALSKAEASADTEPRVKAILDARGRMAEVNPDNHKEDLPEYRHMAEAADPYSGQGVHEESSMLAKKVVAAAYANGNDLLVDGVGDSEGAPEGGDHGKFHKKLREAIDNGYDAHVTVADLSPEEAKKRAYERALKTGRWVPAGFIDDASASVSARHLEWRGDPDISWDVYSNDVAKGEDPILLARKAKGVGEEGIEVVNPKGYATFLGRAKGEAKGEAVPVAKAPQPKSRKGRDATPGLEEAVPIAVGG